MIIIDVEASGTEYTKHSIVSLGAVDFSDPTRRFYGECRIWDGAHIMEGALEVMAILKPRLPTPINNQKQNSYRHFWSGHNIWLIALWSGRTSHLIETWSGTRVSELVFRGTWPTVL